MNDEERNQLFKQLADSFIDLANHHCDTNDNGIVGPAFMYGASRFTAFMVATHSKELERYEAERDEAVNYFTSEFKRMLEENLDSYKRVFQEQPRYAHLVKNNKSDE